MLRKVIRAGQLGSRPGRPGIIPASPETIYRWVREGRFPRPFMLAPGTSVWFVDEVEEHMAKRAAERANAA